MENITDVLFVCSACIPRVFQISSASCSPKIFEMCLVEYSTDMPRDTSLIYSSSIVLNKLKNIFSIYSVFIQLDTFLIHCLFILNIGIREIVIWP